MTEEIIKQQRQTVLQAMIKADIARWPYGAKVQLNERMATKLCIELLAAGFMTLGEGGNRYTIKVIAGTNVEEYLKKAMAET